MLETNQPQPLAHAANEPEKLSKKMFDLISLKAKKCQLITLVFFGPIMSLMLLRLQLGVWWPNSQSVNQFWPNQFWLFGLEFGLGWLIGWLVLWLDQRKSQVWYQSAPLTRSVSFGLMLLALGVFVMTSTQIWLGMALVLSLWSQLTCEAFVFQSDSKALADHFLGDVNLAARQKLADKLTGKLGIFMLGGLVILVGLGAL